jgi:hypothetical protein
VGSSQNCAVPMTVLLGRGRARARRDDASGSREAQRATPSTATRRS